MHPIFYIIAVVWICILFFDLIFKTCMFEPYLKMKSSLGVDICFFVLVIKTERFNYFIRRMGAYRCPLQDTWFYYGAVITIMLIFPCIYLYFTTLLKLFWVDTPEEFENSPIIPMIPGINYPLSYWKSYVLIITFCSAFHELGHAMAASRLDVAIENCGLAVFFIFPVAFVNMRNDQLSLNGRWERATVYCAGIWHNIVLSLTSMAILKYYVLLISPLFYVGGGVRILRVNEHSPLYEPVIGFIPGDVVHSIGNCSVTNLASWRSCLKEIDEKHEGLCVLKRLLLPRHGAVSVEQCIRKPGSVYFEEEKHHKRGICLRVRKAIEKHCHCTDSSDCEETQVCVVPYVPETHKFIVFKRRVRPHVLYVGTVIELKFDVKVSEILPRWEFLSSEFPDTIQEILESIVLFSNGLAAVNLLPVFYFDGFYIMQNFLQLVLRKFYSPDIRVMITVLLGLFSLILAVCLFIVSIYKIYILY